MNITEIEGWIINILSIIGWTINIKYRFYAMLIFTVATAISITYFWATQQTPFFIRSIFYAVIDTLTIWQCIHEKRKVK